MKQLKLITFDTIAVILSVIIFWIPLFYIFVNAIKDSAGASELSLAWPQTVHIWENFITVISARDYMLMRAFYNSSLLTLLSILLMILMCSMVGFILQRRSDKFTPWLSFFVLAGLIIPPAIVPTIWVLDGLHLFKTLPGIIFVEVALGFPFGVILYRNFMASVPREVDEAAIIDGSSAWRLYAQIILPLLKPVTATLIVTSSVSIFNDFVNPLYFFPGAKNVTVQLTLYNFMSQYLTQYNLLFMNILVITIPPLVVFLIFNKKIIAGMTAGSVKG